MQRNMKRKYESPQIETDELKLVHLLLVNSDKHQEPDEEESGEGIPDD